MGQGMFSHLLSATLMGSKGKLALTVMLEGIKRGGTSFCLLLHGFAYKIPWINMSIKPQKTGHSDLWPLSYRSKFNDEAMEEEASEFSYHCKEPSKTFHSVKHNPDLYLKVAEYWWDFEFGLAISWIFVFLYTLMHGSNGLLAIIKEGDQSVSLILGLHYVMQIMSDKPNAWWCHTH